MIYITGDCHGNYDRFHMNWFPEQRDMTKDDYVIVCGDFGYWNDEKIINEQKVLSERRFTTLFVDGNHEQYTSHDPSFKGLNELPVTEWHGGRVHIIPDTDIIHLIRGEVYDIQGQKVLAFGGAASHDIRDGIVPYSDDWKQTAKRWAKEGKVYFRIDGISWWKEENITEEDFENAVKNIQEKTDNGRVDLVVSHCCPTSTNDFMFRGKISDFILPDKNMEYLEKIKKMIDYRKWYFGHYHRESLGSEKDIVIYKKIRRFL